jgi:outer membrane receptor protein involved in Fe transport
VLTTPAHAQDGLEEVVVTGSRIVRRDFTANSPIVSVESDLFENSSTLAVETVLNQLPQFVPAITQFVTTEVQNSPTVTAGANTISLRGLGTNRNLVLVDGRRAQPVNALLAVDTNTIPSSAIERVEVVTGGASATYGADAIAGVVNFILKKDFEGIELDMQHGQTSNNDGAETRVAALFGANFDNGRGNVMIGTEYADREVANRNGRDFYEKAWADPTVNGTQFFQTNTYFLNSGANSISQAAVDGIFTATPAGAVPLNQEFFFNRGDQNVYQADTPEGALRYTDGFEPTAANGFADRKVMADGTIDENQPFAFVSTPLDRYSLFARGRYEVTDGLEVYAQGNFVQTETKTLLLYSPAVTIWNASIPYGAGIHGPSLNGDGTTNADYLPGGSIGVNCAPLGGCTNSEAFPVPADLAALLDSRPDPNATWSLNRAMDYIGPRRTTNTSQTFQMLAGITGGVDAIDGNWDIYYSHGETDTTSRLLGFGDLQGYRNIVQSANYGRGASVNGPGGTGFGTGTCTSGLPIFGNFAVSQNCIDAVTADMTDLTYISQDILEGTVQGRIGDLPAGEVRFAAGASYRENTFDFQVGHLNDGNNSASQAIGLFASRSSFGETDVSEIFAETIIPLIDDAGPIQSFSLEIGARSSDYSIGEKVDTYKFLGDLAFSDSIRLRGGWQRANRAPNIGELFAPNSQSVEGTAFGDACNADGTTAPWGANPASNPNFAQAQALCSQLMGPAAAAVWYGNTQGGGLPGITLVVESGNPNLTSEEADTLTAGIVFSPENFTVSVDWYEIEIDAAIGPAGYDTVYEQCLSPTINVAQDPNNPFCQQITRDPVDGGQQQVSVSQANLGKFLTSGVDVQFSWQTSLSGGGNIGVNVLANVLSEFKTQDLPNAPLLDSAGTGDEGGQFDYRLFNTLNYFKGPFSATLRHRHYPSLDHASIVQNPATTTRGADSYNIFDFNGQYSINDTYEIRFGIDNLLDEDPVIYGASPTTTAQGSTLSGYYDTLGRRMYLGFKAQF